MVLCATALPDLDATSSQRLGTVVVSHVLNELDKPGGEALRRALDKADSILWVEPGTFTDSRALIAVRESLREHFDVVAPCTHAAACGLLRPENARHWCHHFADPPTGLMADSNWVRFAKVSGIDLRSLPYSYLILERRGLRSPIPGGPSPAWSRVLGRPRVYKGFARLLSCQPEGVEELELQKRVDTALFKTLKNETAGSLWKWTREEARITAAEPIRVGPRLTSGGRGRSA